MGCSLCVTFPNMWSSLCSTKSLVSLVKANSDVEAFCDTHFRGDVLIH